MTTKEKTTTEPWTVGVSIDAYGWHVYRIRDMDDPRADSEEVQANARLIAAAPDLLAALQDAESYLDGGVAIENYTRDELMDVIRAAIAKAKEPTP